MNEIDKFTLALAYILVMDARSKGCMDPLYLGSIKLPDFDFQSSKQMQSSEKTQSPNQKVNQK